MYIFFFISPFVAVIAFVLFKAAVFGILVFKIGLLVPDTGLIFTGFAVFFVILNNRNNLFRFVRFQLIRYIAVCIFGRRFTVG